MKRFASHYLHIPSYGFLKQYVVEINSEGYVTGLYPLNGETESIIWAPGVISLVTAGRLSEIKGEKKKLIFEHKQIRTELPVEYNNMASLELVAMRLYPFDFTRMQSTENTILQVLDNYF